MASVDEAFDQAISEHGELDFDQPWSEVVEAPAAEEVPTEGEDEAEGTDEVVEDESDELDEEQDEVEEDTEEAPDEGQVFTVKVDGEEIEVTLDELLGGYSRTSDYTRKTQELADQRREIEASASRLQAMDAFEDALRRDPESALSALREQLGLDDESDEDTVLDPLEREVRELKAFVAEQRQAEADRQTLAEIEMVRTKYDDADMAPEDLLAYAVKHGIPNLEVAYRDMNREKLAEQEAQKRFEALQAERKVKKVTTKRTLPPVAGGASSPAAAIVRGSSSSPSLDESIALALASEGVEF